MTETANTPAAVQLWQRPPFKPGNTVAERHGAYSPRRVDPLAEQFVERALADPDLKYLAAPRFRPALWSWARAEVGVQLLAEHLATITDDSIGDLDEKRVAAAHALLDRYETRADKARARLGLYPTSTKVELDITISDAKTWLAAMRGQ